MAPTVSARSAEPGKPTVESPGPSLPALMAMATSGFAASTESTIQSIRAVPSTSFPTPKLMLSTSGIFRAFAKRIA